MNQGPNQPRIPNVEPAIFEGVTRLNYILGDCQLTRAQHEESQRILQGILVYSERSKAENQSLANQVSELTKASAPDGVPAPAGPSGN